MSNPPIEITPPDISAYKTGNCGVEYVHRFDSGKPGPNVVIQALTHGNEFCGSIALRYLFEHNIRPDIGSLSLVFGNVEAAACWDTSDPNKSRYVDEDFNRVWSDEALKSSRDSVELRRARQLVSVIDQADYLLDIHSMHEPCAPIMVCGSTGNGGEKSAAFSRRLGAPQNLLIDTGHPAGLRMIERGAFGKPNDPRTAVLIECGQHWEANAPRVALDAIWRFLATTGLMSQEAAAEQCNKTGAIAHGAQRTILVTEAVVAQTLDFHFDCTYTGLQVIAKKGDPIASDGERKWTAPYDNTVLVMPSMAHLKVGTTMVRLGRIQ
jgi:predicted deacylase